MKKHYIFRLLLNFILYLIPFFILAVTWWVRRYFGETSFEQILFHLQFGAENLTDSDPALVANFYQRCIYLPLILATLFSFTHTYHKQLSSQVSNIYQIIRVKASSIRLLARFFSLALHSKILLVALIYAAFNFSFFSYLKNEIFSLSVDFYAKNYIDPAKVKLDKKSPKNLILIYVESLENTYNHKELFNENLINAVEPATLGGTSFLKQRQLEGTNWTIAGIASSQCGVPLKPLLGSGNKGKNDSLEKTTKFFPNITCLGDVLKTHGYTNIFIGGASHKFAGKGAFFRSHGYNEVYGRDELLSGQNKKLPTSNWGIYDDDLLAIAKEKIDLLESKKQPYNLTLLTLDTHTPEGHISSTCRTRGITKYKGVVKCTSEMLSDFVKYITEKGYLKNTTVVIMGDHLAMINPEHDKISRVKERFVFNNYISSDVSLKKTRDEIVHFDHFPSILDSMGLHVVGGKLALGVSGFGQNNLSDAQAKERFELLKENIMVKSPTYQHFWISQN